MKRVWGLVIVAAAVLMAGCEFILGPDEAGGNLVIGFGEGGRAAVPTAGELAELRYELVLTGPEDQTITVSLGPGETFNQQVSLGEWHIYAKAYDSGKALIGTGTAAVTVRAGKNEARVRMEPASTYGIGLSETGTYTFPAAVAGYEALTPQTVTVSNTGNEDTGDLTAGLSGADSGSFTLSAASISSIAVGGSGTFTVAPNPELAEGTYTATVTVSGGDGISASFDVSFTVEPAPAYGIGLSETGTYPFPAAVTGYGALTPQTVTVSNTMDGATGDLTAALSGTGSGSFTLNKTTISSIGVGGSDTFTVAPNTGLAEGTYTARVTVSGDNGISASFAVSFTVSPTPGYGIRLSETGTYPFPAAVAGYDEAQTAYITVSNTGNQATGDLTVALSGTNSSSFTLDKTSISSIEVDEEGIFFKVVPNTGLVEGTYTATVTVSGDNGISKNFTVSFTVNPPTYGIRLSQTETYTFPAAVVGYGTQAAHIVTVSNTGNQATGDLTVKLSDSVSFTLDKTSISSIVAGGNDVFKVAPNTGLAAGPHTAVVTVSGGNVSPASFAVSFTVSSTPVNPAYGISLSQTGTYIFPAAVAGYGAQAARTVTVSNTGNQATGDLTVKLSDSGSFTLSAASISSIGVGVEGIFFEVAPKTGLAEGTHTARVTVSGGNSISASFEVSFTVLITLDQSKVIVLATPSSTDLVTITRDNAYGNGAYGISDASSVTLSPFKIAKYETTYELWYEVKQWAKNNGYIFANAGREGHDGTDGAEPTSGAKTEPVTGISWRDAIVWCNAYSEREGETPVYITSSGSAIKDSTNTTACDGAKVDTNAEGYQLPTEAEWEYAARGGGTPSTSGSFVYPYAGSATVDGVAWYSVNSGSATHPVGGKAPNTLGLYDMSGNVAEWCRDQGTNLTAVTWVPVTRGGDWSSESNDCKVDNRGTAPPDNGSNAIGFRVLCRANVSGIN